MANKQNAKKDSQAVIVIANEPINSVITILTEKLKALEHISDSKYVGNTTINSLDIKSETDVKKLYTLAGELSLSEEVYNKGALLLAAPSTIPVFTVEGNDVETHLKNIKLRIDLINQSTIQKKLEEFAKEGQQFITKEEQKSIYLSKVDSFLNSLG